MGKGILLDKELGINPAMTYCPRCGGETQELALVGRARKFKCTNCGLKILGKKPLACPKCGNSSFESLGKFDGSYEKLPASELCDACKAELELFKEEVEKGGVLWKCCDCNCEGVVKHDAPFAIEFVEKNGKNVGVQFSKETCPACRD